MDFELTLTDEKVKPHQSTALHLLVAFTVCISGAITLLLYKLFTVNLGSADPISTLNLLKWIGISIITIGILMLGLIIIKSKWLKRPKTNAAFRVFELLMLLFFCGFSILEHITIPAITYGLLVIATLMALFWENNGNNNVKVFVTDEGIRLPFHARRRFIAWTEIEVVLLRFGILTIDCTNNKLYQWDVRYADFDADTFEKYCDKIVEENKSKRIADW